MFDQLKIDHCLYEIDHKHLTEFIQLSNAYQLDGYVKNAASLNPLNNHAVVLQIWCFLNEKEYNFYFKQEKIIPYSIDHFILQQLRTNDYLTFFLNSRELTQIEKYILAFNLGCTTLKWGDSVIAEHVNAQKIFKKGNEGDYFVDVVDEGVPENLNEEFYDFQKTIVKLMGQNILNKPHFKELIFDTVNFTKLFINQVKIN